MSASFIVDCSLTMAWLFKDEATLQSTELLERFDAESALVPALWFPEVTNVLAIAERKNRITQNESEDFVTQLSQLDIEVDTEPSERAFTQLLPLCRAHQLTSYDTVYLELAIRRQLPLATLDEPLRKVALGLGIKLLGK